MIRAKKNAGALLSMTKEDSLKQQIKDLKQQLKDVRYERDELEKDCEELEKQRKEVIKDVQHLCDKYKET